jgi:hypothetical protein
VSFGAGFSEQTATVYRGAGKTKENLGTLSVHVQPLSSTAIMGGGGLFPLGSFHAFYDGGSPDVDVKQGDWMKIGDIMHAVLDVKPHTQGMIKYYDYIVGGYNG